jgi:outer membrane protein OmpA-like peptidoglycan-associated protein
MESNENNWLNIADIMSALMMIFMFIAVAFLYQILNEKEVYKVELNRALHVEFDKDLEEWQAIITDDNILRFNSPFKSGSDEMPESYKKILSDFFPRYIKLLSSDEFKKEIAEIRVEGHTSYGWGELKDEKSIYINNMNLSQKRASNVLAYCYGLENQATIQQQRDWLQDNLRANGMSYSNLLYTDESKTIQDANRSRRVEFKVVVREQFKKMGT